MKIKLNGNFILGFFSPKINLELGLTNQRWALMSESQLFPHQPSKSTHSGTTTTTLKSALVSDPKVEKGFFRNHVTYRIDSNIEVIDEVYVMNISWGHLFYFPYDIHSKAEMQVIGYQ